MEKMNTYYFNLTDYEVETLIGAIVDSSNDMYDQYHIYNNVYNVLWDNILKQVNRQNAFPCWNPYPAYAPDKSGWYSVTLESKLSKNNVVRSAYYSIDYDTWSTNNCSISNVIAFRDLPTAYNPDTIEYAR